MKYYTLLMFAAIKLKLLKALAPVKACSYAFEKS